MDESVELMKEVEDLKAKKRIAEVREVKVLFFQGLCRCNIAIIINIILRILVT